MIVTQRAGQKLGARHISMFWDGEFFRFLVDVVPRRHPMASRDDPKGLILDWLETALDEGLLDNGSPNSRGVGKGRLDVQFEGVCQKTDLAPPFVNDLHLRTRPISIPDSLLLSPFSLSSS